MKSALLILTRVITLKTIMRRGLRLSTRSLSSALRSTPPPAALTTILTRAPSASDLLRVHERHHEAFNAIHVSAFWVRLGRLARGCSQERAWLRANPRAVEHSRECTIDMLPRLDSRELANTAHGVASTGVGSALPWSEFWSGVASSALPQLDRFSAAELKNTVWAFATARTRAPALFDDVAAETMSRLEQLRPEEVAMLAWAYARSGHEAPALLASLGAVAERQLPQYGPRELASTAWALAHADAAAPGFFDALAAHLPSRAAELGPTELASAAWGLGRAGRATAELLDALAPAARAALPRFGTRNLATLATPYSLSAASLGEPSRELLLVPSARSARGTDSCGAGGLMTAGTSPTGGG